ncbi:uncharacterized protein EKO05_0010716 [Ascochyta rabiei]|uniref:Uncharacterized protein n=1 Tax=Didymella rabiei TaxID=5454 RepID=A0A163L1K9_DIDRA|nr:uncharacterized protein EKO05_0010716 [Ascochyta rabiei]KZM27430.1 hypothetical protein ST47_g1422 [Ascochyta rabiei]UPX20486.1 hypothetical protein EKO05_0010716 [Ascochyta rabiei]
MSTQTALELSQTTGERRRSFVATGQVDQTPLSTPKAASISARSSYFPDLAGQGKRVGFSELPPTSSIAITPAGAQTPAGASTPGWTTPGTATPAGWMSPSGQATPGWATPKSSQMRPLMFPEEAYPDIGSIHTWRGVLILVITCGAQLMDNVFMTAVNLSLPEVQAEFNVSSGDLQWLLSAYTLTFGGFLLFSGVLSDRYGRRLIFSAGMFWLSIWTLANGFATSFIQIAIFRALQGIGAAMTVPSAIGIISSHFVASERVVALTFFGASGAIGFCAGLLFGGFVTEALGWRYIFRIAVAVTTPLGLVGCFYLPKDRREGSAKPSLDFLGAGLSTSGLILLSFVLSSGGEYGWNKAFIIALLVISVAMLGVFTYVEKKVRNPIMPMSLWKIKNFAPLWITGFVVYGAYQTVIYYVVLQAQEVAKLSAGATALRFLPMGAAGFATNMVLAKWMKYMDIRYLMSLGMVTTLISPIPASLMPAEDPSFWRYILPTSVMVVVGVSICYICITNIMLESVPTNVKSLCGGLVNTAFQIGSGVSLALAAAVVDAVDIKKGHTKAKQYQTGLFCCVGLALLGLLVSMGGMRGLRKSLGGAQVH